MADPKASCKAAYTNKQPVTASEKQLSTQDQKSQQLPPMPDTVAHTSVKPEAPYRHVCLG